MLKWLKGIFNSKDMADLDESGTMSDRDVDKLVKKHLKEENRQTPKVVSKIKQGLEDSKQRRDEKKELKKDDFGDKTTEDISQRRRNSVFSYLWKGVGVMFVIIILTALYSVITTYSPTTKQKKENTKLLDGISTEDADHFQSLTSSQINALAGTISRIEEEAKAKESATQKALLAEAEKNKKLQEKIDELQTKADEEKLKDRDQEILAIVEDKLKQMKDEMASKASRPMPASIHKIMPIPDSNISNDSDILVDGVENKVVLSAPIDSNLSKEDVRDIKEKIDKAAVALKEEALYEDVAIDVITMNDSLNDGNLSGGEEKQPPLHIMTGFARAILITGVDAPTFTVGKYNPVPVILSLTSNEIIANGYDSDINDCMLIGQSFGNMNTSRVEIEVTRISCNMKRDGVMQKIEENVKGWVYDENGVHGLKGRLVDSSGKIITREMAIGFLEGTAAAFSQPNTVVNTAGALPSQIFTTQSTENAMYGGAASGVGTALSGLADYYKKMLDGAYPVVSVRSGRRVTVLFKGGEDVKEAPYTRINVSNVDDENEVAESMEIDTNGW